MATWRQRSVTFFATGVLAAIGQAWFGADRALAFGDGKIFPNVKIDAGAKVWFNIYTPQKMYQKQLAPWYTYFPYDPSLMGPPHGSPFPNWPQPFPPVQPGQQRPAEVGMGWQPAFPQAGATPSGPMPPGRLMNAPLAGAPPVNAPLVNAPPAAPPSSPATGLAPIFPQTAPPPLNGPLQPAGYYGYGGGVPNYWYGR